MRRTLFPAIVVFGLLASPVVAQTAQAAVEPDTATAPHQYGQPYAMPQMINPFDPSSWKDTAGPMQPGMTIPFNPASPGAWAMWVNPQTHAKMHMAFTNPAQYAQFMQPQFYMQFMDPNSWMAWANPASYAPFMDPATWTYWMQPGSYMHGMSPVSYMQMMNPAYYSAFMNPATYMGWMNPAGYAVPVTSGAPTAYNWFDPNAWMKMFDPNAYNQAMGTTPTPESTESTTQ